MIRVWKAGELSCACIREKRALEQNASRMPMGIQRDVKDEVLESGSEEASFHIEWGRESLHPLKQEQSRA